MTAICDSRDSRVTHILFPGTRPGNPATARVEPGSIPRNGLPEPGYVYRGTGTDTLTAFMDDEPDQGQPRGRALSPCGTQAAYRRHLRHGEKPCWECAEANRITFRLRSTP